MRLIICISAIAVLASGCEKSTGEDIVQEGYKACIAAVESYDGTVLTSSALVAKIERPVFIYNWPKEQHGANYSCTVNVLTKRMTELSKDEVLILSDITPKLRKF